MRCEVVAVGTELLLGQITDTNSSWIGEQLALVGIDSLRQTKVGDNLGRMVEVIGEAIDRADAVIVCGGLGPTQDDITRDAIARVMGVDLDLDDEVVARIEAMFGGRGRRMPMNNLRQAEVPIGATAIADPQPGTAPGLICPLTRPGDDGAPVEKVIYAVPGVPYEMMEIVSGGDPARPPAPGRAHRRDPQPHPAHVGRRASRPWPSSSPIASPPSTGPRRRGRRPGRSPSPSWPRASRGSRFA